MNAFRDPARRRVIIRRFLAQAALAGVWLLACPTLGEAAPSISADSVWVAPEAAMLEVQSGCGPIQSGRTACYRAVAAQYGASPAALEAIGLLNGEGHVTGFRPAGRVDLAAALFPFRANQNAALLVVNGDPPVVDADGPTVLARMLEPSRPGESVAPVFPFPGDRLPLDAVAVEAIPDGGLHLALPYEIRACRACPTLATLSYRLGFDQAGRLRGIDFVSSAGEKAVLGEHPGAIRIAPGDVVAIRLSANRTTGYVWVMEPLPGDGPLGLLWRAYRLTTAPRPGSPGEDFFWLEARHPGAATATFRYLRPWQPGPGTKVRRFIIQIAAP
jgi:predicted secreted protein